VFAEDGADAADDAGDVLVADGEERALEGRFDVDAVEVEEAGGLAVEDGAAGGDAGFAGVEAELEDAAGSAAGLFFLFFMKADAALLGDGSGVDAVDLLEVAEDAGDGAVADQLGFGFGETAVVGELDGVDAAAGDLGEEGAEALGKGHPGGELLVFLMAERGQVDGVLGDAGFEVVADLEGDLDADGLLGFGGGSGDVGGEDDVVEGGEGGVSGGLLVEDVEGGAGDVTGLEGGGQVGFDDELAAGAVDDADAFLHGGEGGGVEDAGGLRGEADVEGEEVGHREELFDGDEADGVFAGDGGGDEGVVAEELHAEVAGAAGDFEADAAKAEDAEFFSAELGALEGFFLPLAGVHGGVGAGELTGEGDHEAEGELGDGDGIGAGSVHDDDAAAGGGFGIDVVDTDAGAADDAETGAGGHEGIVDLDCGADDEGIGVGEGGGKVFDLVVGEDLPAGFGLEDSEGGGRDFFREDDFQIGSFGYRVIEARGAERSVQRSAFRVSGWVRGCVQWGGQPTQAEVCAAQRRLRVCGGGGRTSVLSRRGRRPRLLRYHEGGFGARTAGAGACRRLRIGERRAAMKGLAGCLTERRRRGQNDAGFTLMELLIVISIMLILMLIAIPNMLNLRATANETSAKQSLRAIQEAETQYATNFPANGFACSLAALGGSASTGAPNPQSAQLLQGDLAGGNKAGYSFNIVNCQKAPGSQQDDFVSYEVTAVPQVVGKTGHNGFCLDMSGEIKEDPSGGTNCTVPIQ